MDLTFAEVSAVNRTRCERWHPGFPNDGWTGSDWSNAMAGEAGEACNKVKKLRRLDFDLHQAAGDTRGQLLADLAIEIGDTFIYLDLLAQHYGLDIARCIVHTFNRVSVREGFPDRIGAGAGQSMVVMVPAVSAETNHERFWSIVSRAAYDQGWRRGAAWDKDYCDAVRQAAGWPELGWFKTMPAGGDGPIQQEERVALVAPGTRGACPGARVTLAP